MFASLRYRLLMALIFMYGFGGAASLTIVWSSIDSARFAIEETTLSAQAKALLAGLQLDGSGRGVTLTIPAHWRGAYREPGGAYFTLFDPEGHPVAKSANLSAPLSFVPPGPGETVSALRIEGPQQDIAVSAVGQHGYILAVARSNPGRFETLKPDFIEYLVPSIGLALAAVLGLTVAWAVVVISLKPLVKVSADAASIGPEKPSARLSEVGLPTEVLPFVRAINAGLDRVAEAHEVEKRFTADAAHTLRTPLAVLDLRIQRGQADGVTDWSAVRRDVGELARVVSGLVSLSTAERAGSGARQPVNLARLVREVSASFEQRLEAEGRELMVLAPDSVPLASADAGALRDMICVLIDNALAHGMGLITVDVGALNGREAILRVTDEGCGVADGGRGSVFKLFRKLNVNVLGASLDLAIVRRTARDHGGDANFVGAASAEVHLR